jgi:hypothetical protein
MIRLPANGLSLIQPQLLALAALDAERSSADTEPGHAATASASRSPAHLTVTSSWAVIARGFSDASTKPCREARIDDGKGGDSPISLRRQS